MEYSDRHFRIGVVGCSIGAYHAANFALKFPHFFHYALCVSGFYDVEAICGYKCHSREVYFNNPLAYVYNLTGADLERVRRNTHLALVCGRGGWKPPHFETRTDWQRCWQ